MGLDEDFHQLAVDYPEALLALLGAADPGAGYRGLSPEIKASTRRIDVVLEPEAHDGPSYVVELYGYRNDDALRNLLEKHVGYCRQTGRWAQVEAACCSQSRGTRRAYYPSTWSWAPSSAFGR